MNEIKSFDKTLINYSIERKKSKTFLVFVHGAGGSLTAWKKERDFFHSKDVSTLAIDLRGHGLSGRPKKIRDYGLDNFAKDIKAVLDVEKIENFILIGHCFGGMVTIEFQKLYPNLAKSYILVDTTSKAPQKLRAARILSSPVFLILNSLLTIHSLLPLKGQNHQEDFDKFAGTGDWNLRRIYSDISHTSLRSWFFTYQHVASFDGSKVLQGIKVPVLIIHGEKDGIFSVDRAKETNALIEKSILDIIPEENHIIVLNSPILVAEKIYTFCKNLI
jgi:pimeloyl-ACP methyl ester carboxylesterase